MKFRYYITDLYDGKIKGTNSTEDAINFASCEDFFVVDTQTGEWLMLDGSSLSVEEV